MKFGKLVSLLFFITLIYFLQYGYFRVSAWLTDQQSMPLSSLILTGNIKHIAVNDVRKILIAQQNRLNFFTLEIAEIQQEIENLPWVYSASIRKRWPDTLKIHIVEQSIVAIWNDKTLLNRFGEIITVSPDTTDDKLATLYGEDQFAGDILTDYMKINRLLKVNKFKIASLTSDKRHSSDVTLDNGIALRLGQEQQLDRIQRFLSVYPLLEKEYDITTIDYIDLRYDTGFAIGWKNKLK
ncbi:cell division protein FtsQ/DivIB [Psychromonas sp. MME1]|uniref:cell division protein FtsQ/DivIB n=1 Tax=Psychromonas sp. MME1 TaxID=3231032 RepID=UPI0034E1FE99